MSKPKATIKELCRQIALSNPAGATPAAFPMQDATFRQCSAAIQRFVHARQGRPLRLPSALLPPLP